MDYEKAYKKALETARDFLDFYKDNPAQAQKFIDIFPELAESEDERLRNLLVWQVHRNIEDDTNDLAGSIYDGIKGHDPDLEESIEDWKKCLAWLEKQKEQKPSWSEDDEKMIERLITRLNWITYNTRTDGTSPNITFLDEIDWLKSLRLRPSWKPSEEQIYSLGTVVKGYNECTVGSVGYNLKELYEHLKKLM